MRFTECRRCNRSFPTHTFHNGHPCTVALPPPLTQPVALSVQPPVSLASISFAWNESNPHVSINLVGEPGLVGLPKDKLVMCFTISADRVTSLRRGLWTDTLLDYFGAEYASVRTQLGVVRVHSNKTKVTSFREPCTIS